MIQVPNNVITDLVRHIPLILEQLPQRPNGLRVENAIRLTKKNILKLKKLSDERTNEQQSRG